MVLELKARELSQDNTEYLDVELREVQHEPLSAANLGSAVWIIWQAAQSNEKDDLSMVRPTDLKGFWTVSLPHIASVSSFPVFFQVKAEMAASQMQQADSTDSSILVLTTGYCTWIWR